MTLSGTKDGHALLEWAGRACTSIAFKNYSLMPRLGGSLLIQNQRKSRGGNHKK